MTESEREELMLAMMHEWMGYQALRWPTPYGQPSESCALRNRAFERYARFRDQLMGKPPYKIKYKHSDDDH